LGFVVLAVSGLVVDGTRAFLLRRTLQNAADAAALAGAGEVDVPAYYSSGGRTIVLRPEAAQRAAHRWLAARGIAGRVVVDVEAEGVAVVLRSRVDTLFLRLAGIDSVPVAVSARAGPLSSL
jgi:hypothetical protein